MPEAKQTVLLQGGPMHDRWAEVYWGQSLLVEGDPVPEGIVARYRPTRSRRSGIYRFREYDRIVLRIPGPADRSAGEGSA